MKNVIPYLCLEKVEDEGVAFDVLVHDSRCRFALDRKLGPGLSRIVGGNDLRFSIERN